MGRIRNSVFMMVVVFMGSYLGGMTTEYFFAKPAEAKKEKLIEADRIVARSLHIVDEKGNPRGAFGETNEGVVLGLFDRKGNHRIAMMVENNEKAGLTISDRKGNSRIGLIYDPAGMQGLAYHDGKGETRLELGYFEGKQTGLQIYEAGETKSRIDLVSLANGSRGLTFFSPVGKPLVGIGDGPNGNSVAVNDENGNVRAGMIHSKDGTNLLIADEKKKILWEAP